MVSAQADSLRLGFWQRSEGIQKGRIWGLSSSLVVGYAATTIALDRVWYAAYPRSRFHFFNDWNGWRQMDKGGHAFTTYFESKWVGDMYYWAGMRKKKAALVGFATGMLFQSTLELLDGFSAQWGFSWGDMGFNALGGGLYLGQELLWQEQRIKLKLSSHRPRYSTAPLQAINGGAGQSSAEERARALYGRGLSSLLLKEYNGQTIWLSVNPASFCRERPRWLPAWVNVSVGYGIENVLGAQRNSWTDEAGNVFVVPPAQSMRMSQYFLSLDIDWERIPARRPFVRALLRVINIFKLPFPTLEINSQGRLRGYFLYF